MPSRVCYDGLIQCIFIVTVSSVQRNAITIIFSSLPLIFHHAPWSALKYYRASLVQVVHYNVQLLLLLFNPATVQFFDILSARDLITSL